MQGSTVHCIYGFIPPPNPGQNPGQKPGQKSGQKSGGGGRLLPGGAG